jgi:hypothetical protein
MGNKTGGGFTSDLLLFARLKNLSYPSKFSAIIRADKNMSGVR